MAASRQPGGVAALMKAAKDGDIHQVEGLLASGIDADSKDGRGRSALHYAAVAGHTAVCRVMLTHRASVNIRDRDLNTPLHLTVQKGHIGVCKFLVQKEASRTAKNKKDQIPLHVAALAGHKEISRYLLRLINDFAAQTDANDNTPLHQAALKGDVAKCRELLKSGADPDVGNSNKNTALHLAAYEGHLDVCRELVHYKANVEAVNEHQSSALLKAAYNGKDAVCIFLLQQCDATVTVFNTYTWNSLHLASLCGLESTVKTLVALGAPLNLADAGGNTALTLVDMPDVAGFIKQTVHFESGGMVYDMRAFPRGHLLIINNTFKGTEKERHGSNKDRDRLKEVFRHLGFKVTISEERTSSEFREDLQMFLRSESVAHTGAVALAILSHGCSKGVLFSDNVIIDLSVICGIMSVEPAVKGKPKIIIGQFCRGTEVRGQEDPGIAVRMAPDTVLICASGAGYEAHRHKLYGSRFIWILCDTLKQWAWKLPLAALLPKVIEIVSLDLRVSSPEVQSKLTKHMYFNPVMGGTLYGVLPFHLFADDAAVNLSTDGRLSFDDVRGSGARVRNLSSGSGDASFTQDLIVPTTQQIGLFHVPSVTCRRGHAFIMSNSFRGTDHERPGWETDQNNLCLTFRNLGIEVALYENGTKEATLRLLRQFLEKEVVKSCCVVIVALLSCGSDNRMLCTNGEYLPLTEVTRILRQRKDLKTKPKVLISQLCPVAEEDDDEVRQTRPPAVMLGPEMLLFSAAGYSAEGDGEQGSPFVRELCRELRDGARSTPLAYLLLKVTYKLSREFDSPTTQDQMGKLVNLSFQASGSAYTHKEDGSDFSVNAINLAITKAV